MNEAEAGSARDRFEMAMNQSAWLIRKLINRYHGDVTLAIASYYEAARDDHHSIYEYRSLKEHEVSLDVNQSDHVTNRKNRGGPQIFTLEFTRLALSIWREQ